MHSRDARDSRDLIKPRMLIKITATMAACCFWIAVGAERAIADPFDDGQSVMQRGDFQGAVSLFNQAIVNNEKDWRPFLKRGQCLYQMGDFHLASNDFSEVVKLDKTNPDGFFWRANAYAKMGLNNLATGDYNEVLKLSPYYIADHSRGVEGASANGVTTNTGVSGVSGGAGSGTAGSASAGAAAGTGAASAISTATNTATSASSTTKSAAAFHLKAALFGGSKDPDKDIEQFTNAIGLDPLNSKLLYQRAKAYIQCFRYQAALDDLNNAIMAEPNNASYYLARAFVYHKEGQDVVGMEDIKQAQFVDPGLPKAIDFESQ